MGTTQMLLRLSYWLSHPASRGQGTNVSICLDGRCHLGAALGSSSFIEDYITAKVQSWSEELSSLENIALTHPHAAYAQVFLISSSHWRTLSVSFI